MGLIYALTPFIFCTYMMHSIHNLFNPLSADWACALAHEAVCVHHFLAARLTYTHVHATKKTPLFYKGSKSS